MNKLFYVNNLDVMRKLIRDETIELFCIDPPFNSKGNYNQMYNNIGTEDRERAPLVTGTATWDDGERRFRPMSSWSVGTTNRFSVMESNT